MHADVENVSGYPDSCHDAISLSRDIMHYMRKCQHAPRRKFSSYSSDRSSSSPIPRLAGIDDYHMNDTAASGTADCQLEKIKCHIWRHGGNGKNHLSFGGQVQSIRHVTRAGSWIVFPRVVGAYADSGSGRVDPMIHQELSQNALRTKPPNAVLDRREKPQQVFC
jgi:hypothetical protein